MATPLPAAPLSEGSKFPASREALLANARIVIGQMGDCLQRAIDGLAVDPGNPVDTCYVEDQLTKAGRFLTKAHAFVIFLQMEGADCLNEAESTPLEPRNSLFPADRNNGPYEGGA